MRDQGAGNEDHGLAESDHGSRDENEGRRMRRGHSEDVPLRDTGADRGMRGPETTPNGTYRTVREAPVSDGVPRLCNPEWAERFPGLCQGTTWRGTDGSFDMGLFGPGPGREVQGRWELLAGSTGFARVAHGRQVHGARVTAHGPGPAGRLLVRACDGHVTDVPGTLLVVATADCVPVSLTLSDSSAVALLHAGWRGVAAGILEAGVERLLGMTRGSAAALHLHLGPAICGRCYEVGPEVHGALGVPVPEAPLPIDLRRVLADRAVALGVPRDHVTVSTLCTRCGDAGLFSHRGGDTGRQVAYLGIRADG